MYVSRWEALAASLLRAMNSSLNEQSAKIQICNAIADGAIAVRVQVDGSDPDIPGMILSGMEVDLPLRLQPANFDWDKSIPLFGVRTGPDEGRGLDPSWKWTRRSIAVLELYTEDVIKIFALPSPLSRKAEQSAPLIPERARGGRPSAAYWDDFWIELVLLADLDELPSDRTKTQRHMMQWAADRAAEAKAAPDEKTIREKLRELYLEKIRRSQTPSG